MSPLPGEVALPSSMVVRVTLADMLGRNVKLVPSDRWVPKPRDPAAVGVYVDDRWKLQALICCDLALSVALSASIALIPARTAADCLKEGQLTGELAENLYEVLNILAALFNRQDGPHVKLDAMHAPGTPPPPDVAVQLKAFGSREDLIVEVAGYGSGHLSLMLA
jgi:hypothetical protein